MKTWQASLRAWAAIAFIALAPQAFAVQPDEVLSDPALEAQARALSAQLRCMVCQNQSIDDSDAPLAKDIRVLIRERLVKGESVDQIRDFLVSRYGDFILLKPPFNVSTLLLWLGAPLALGLAALAMATLRKPGAIAAPPLTPEEERQLAKLQGADGGAPG
jgi:cytochrome c-type biogenesis protein CcmH